MRRAGGRPAATGWCTVDTPVAVWSLRRTVLGRLRSIGQQLLAERPTFAADLLLMR